MPRSRYSLNDTGSVSKSKGKSRRHSSPDSVLEQITKPSTKTVLKSVPTSLAKSLPKSLKQTVQQTLNGRRIQAKDIKKLTTLAVAAISVYGVYKYRKAIRLAYEHRGLIVEFMLLDQRYNYFFLKLFVAIATKSMNSQEIQNSLYQFARVLQSKLMKGLNHMLKDKASLQGNDKEEYEASEQALADIHTLLNVIDVIAVYKTSEQDSSENALLPALTMVMYNDEQLSPKEKQNVLLKTFLILAPYLRTALNIYERAKNAPEEMVNIMDVARNVGKDISDAIFNTINYFWATKNTDDGDDDVSTPPSLFRM